MSKGYPVQMLDERTMDVEDVIRWARAQNSMDDLAAVCRAAAQRHKSLRKAQQYQEQLRVEGTMNAGDPVLVKVRGGVRRGTFLEIRRNRCVVKLEGDTENKWLVRPSQVMEFPKVAQAKVG